MPKYNKKINDTEIRLGEVRFGYVHVFSPQLDEQGQPDKYSCCIMIPKENKEAVRLIKEAIEAAKALGKTKWGGKTPSGDRVNPLHDGDEERSDKPEYEGMYYLNAKSKNKPGVRVLEDGRMSEPLGEEDFYSGCWGAATVSFYAYAHVSGSKGIGVSLGNVIKTRDDERLSGGVSADSAFADLADEDFDL